MPSPEGHGAGEGPRAPDPAGTVDPASLDELAAALVDPVDDIFGQLGALSPPPAGGAPAFVRAAEAELGDPGSAAAREQALRAPAAARGPDSSQSAASAPVHPSSGDSLGSSSSARGLAASAAPPGVGAGEGGALAPSLLPPKPAAHLPLSSPSAGVASSIASPARYSEATANVFGRPDVARDLPPNAAPPVGGPGAGYGGYPGAMPGFVATGGPFFQPSFAPPSGAYQVAIYPSASYVGVPYAMPGYAIPVSGPAQFSPGGGGPYGPPSDAMDGAFPPGGVAMLHAGLQLRPPPPQQHQLQQQPYGQHHGQHHPQHHGQHRAQQHQQHQQHQHATAVGPSPGVAPSPAYPQDRAAALRQGLHPHDPSQAGGQGRLALEPDGDGIGIARGSGSGSSEFGHAHSGAHASGSGSGSGSGSWPRADSTARGPAQVAQPPAASHAGWGAHAGAGGRGFGGGETGAAAPPPMAAPATVGSGGLGSAPGSRAYFGVGPRDASGSSGPSGVGAAPARCPTASTAAPSAGRPFAPSSGHAPVLASSAPGSAPLVAHGPARAAVPEGGDVAARAAVPPPVPTPILVRSAAPAPAPASVLPSAAIAAPALVPSQAAPVSIVHARPGTSPLARVPAQVGAFASGQPGGGNGRGSGSSSGGGDDDAEEDRDENGGSDEMEDDRDDAAEDLNPAPPKRRAGAAKGRGSGGAAAGRGGRGGRGARGGRGGRGGRGDQVADLEEEDAGPSSRGADATSAPPPVSSRTDRERERGRQAQARYRERLRSERRKAAAERALLHSNLAAARAEHAALISQTETLQRMLIYRDQCARVLDIAAADLASAAVGQSRRLGGCGARSAPRGPPPGGQPRGAAGGSSAAPRVDLGGARALPPGAPRLAPPSLASRLYLPAGAASMHSLFLAARAVNLPDLRGLTEGQRGKIDIMAFMIAESELPPEVPVVDELASADVETLSALFRRLGVELGVSQSARHAAERDPEPLAITEEVREAIEDDRATCAAWEGGVAREVADGWGHGVHPKPWTIDREGSKSSGCEVGESGEGGEEGEELQSAGGAPPAAPATAPGVGGEAPGQALAAPDGARRGPSDQGSAAKGRVSPDGPLSEASSPVDPAPAGDASSDVFCLPPPPAAPGAAEALVRAPPPPEEEVASTPGGLGASLRVNADDWNAMPERAREAHSRIVSLIRTVIERRPTDVARALQGPPEAVAEAMADEAHWRRAVDATELTPEQRKSIALLAVRAEEALCGVVRRRKEALSRLIALLSTNTSPDLRSLGSRVYEAMQLLAVARDTFSDERAVWMHVTARTYQVMTLRQKVIYPLFSWPCFPDISKIVRITAEDVARENDEADALASQLAAQPPARMECEQTTSA